MTEQLGENEVARRAQIDVSPDDVTQLFAR